jgi:hypothetical protein
MAVHNVIALIAAAHNEDPVELEDFAAPEAMSDFAVSVVRNMIAARSGFFRD